MFFQDYALIIYRMPDMEEIGLRGLTHILRGGVRIEENSKLCYDRDVTKGGNIDWKRILTTDYYMNNLDIKDNSYINTCPGYCNEKLQCPTTSHNGKPRRLCWSENLCQIGQAFFQKLQTKRQVV